MDGFCNRLYPKALEILEIYQPERSSNNQRINTGNFNAQNINVCLFFCGFWGSYKIRNYTLDMGYIT